MTRPWGRDEAKLDWGPLSPLGIGTALAVLAVDQAHKWWMLLVYRIEERVRVAVTPFLDLVYVKNLGVSYGLFLQDSREGQWVLAAFAVLASLAMAVWLARGITDKLMAVSLGLIMVAPSAMPSTGYSRWGATFSHFMHWLLLVRLNIADAASVAGVGGLLYDSEPESQSASKSP